MSTSETDQTVMTRQTMAEEVPHATPPELEELPQPGELPWIRPVVPQHSGGVRAILGAYGVSVRLNARTDRLDWWYDPDNDVAPHDDEWPFGPTPLLGDGTRWCPLPNSVRRAIKDRARKTHLRPLTGDKTGPFKMTADDWRNALSSVGPVLGVDPFLEWVERLPLWDGVPRVERWLVDVLAAEPGPLTEWAGRTLLVGALDRAHNPGAVIHEHLVLIGPQGTGKSSALKGLMPVPDWHGPMRLDIDPKKLIENTRSKVIVELDEMAGWQRAQTEAMKSLLSAEIDTARKAYAEDTEDVPRRFVMAGTSNSETALPYDATGHRRFVALRTPGGRMPGSEVHLHMAVVREQMWAEARDRRDRGENGWTNGRLPDSLRAEQAARNAEHAQDDPTLDDKIEALPNVTMPMQEIARLCNLTPRDEPDRPLDRGEQHRLGDCLRSHGWTSKRLFGDGKQHRVWTPPDLQSR